MINMSWYTVHKWKLMNSRLWFILLLSSTYMWSCASNGEQSATHTNKIFDVESNVPVDFMDFYMKFHQDSLYQMEHIQFPLSGMPSMALEMPQDSINNFKWEAEDWKLHKPFMGNDEEYLKEFRVIDDNLISEFIVETQMGYGMERRFSKLGNRWYLIYYMDMNKME